MRFGTALCIIVLVFQLGCNPAPKYPSWQPSDSASCAGPCWNGLVVGKSQDADVVDTLKRLAFLAPGAISPVPRTCCITGDEGNENSGTEILAYCNQPPTLCLEAGISNGIFAGLDITPNSHFTIGQSLEVIGNPDRVGFQLQGAETIICDINLVWEAKQLVLTARSESGLFSGVPDCDLFIHAHKIKASISITEVRYKTITGLQFLYSRQPSEYLPFDASMLEQ